MSKRPTRWKAEVYHDGDVHWEVLVHDFPDPALLAVLRSAGYKVRRANIPKTTGPTTLVYSVLDPENSVTAAREHAARHDTQVGNALILLLDADGRWVPRDAIRRVAGDSGDRRVRELRERNWPVEIKQLAAGEAWHVRILLPHHDPDRAHIAPVPDFPEPMTVLPPLDDDPGQGRLWEKACKVPGCPLPVHAEDLCEPHHTRQHRHAGYG